MVHSTPTHNCANHTDVQTGCSLKQLWSWMNRLKGAHFSAFNFIYKERTAKEILLLFSIWLHHFYSSSHNPCPSFIHTTKP